MTSATDAKANQSQEVGLQLVVGEVAGYLVVVNGDTVVVSRDGKLVTRQSVTGLGKFVKQAKDLKLGWGRFEDEFEVVYLYDTGDEHFGYGVNLSDEWCSEWGYAPF